MKYPFMILAALLLAPLTSFPAQESTKPNFLVIMTDQLRIDAMSCAGNQWVKTPSLDELASRGVRFCQSYCASPLCMPSRFSLATSRMAFDGRAKETAPLRIPAKMPSTGVLFRAAGYRTAWTGKWHVRSRFPASESQGGDLPGFEVLKNALIPDLTASGESEPEGGGEKIDPGIAEAAIAFLKEKQTKPFLLTVSLLNPHDICGNNERRLAGQVPPSVSDDLPPLPGNLNAPNLTVTPVEGGHPPKGRKNTWQEISFRRYLYQYYRLTEKSDKLIGNILATLKESGLEKNTIVLFTSDHGDMGGSHRIVMKTVPYEESIAVPFIIAGPGIPTGKVDKKNLVSGLDVLPTLCDLAGIAVPETLLGKSIRPILNDQTAPWKEAIFLNVDENQQRVVRTDRYKYIRLNRPNDNEVLFDLQQDPGETKNMVTDPGLSTTLSRHRKLLDDWMKKTSDPFSANINLGGSDHE